MKKIIALLMALACMFGVAAAEEVVYVQPEPTEPMVYVTELVVREVYHWSDIFFAEDRLGNWFSFTEVEDWEPLDFMRVYFSDNGTPNDVHDDVALEYWFIGSSRKPF